MRKLAGFDLLFFCLIDEVLYIYFFYASIRGSLKGSLKGKSKTKLLFDYKSRARLATNDKVGSINESVEIEGILNCFELVRHQRNQALFESNIE